MLGSAEALQKVAPVRNPEATVAEGADKASEGADQAAETGRKAAGAGKRAATGTAGRTVHGRS